MDAKKFLSIVSIECQLHDDCNECPFDNKGVCYYHIIGNTWAHIDSVIAIAEKLNHKKTFADDFFEKFPNAPKCFNGIPRPCRKFIYPSDTEPCCCSCDYCWNKIMSKGE